MGDSVPGNVSLDRDASAASPAPHTAGQRTGGSPSLGIETIGFMSFAGLVGGPAGGIGGAGLGGGLVLAGRVPWPVRPVVWAAAATVAAVGEGAVNVVFMVAAGGYCEYLESAAAGALCAWVAYALLAPLWTAAIALRFPDWTLPVLSGIVWVAWVAFGSGPAHEFAPVMVDWFAPDAPHAPPRWYARVAAPSLVLLRLVALGGALALAAHRARDRAASPDEG